MGLHSLFALTCLSVWQSASVAATLTGVLYGNQGGVSGTAIGEVRLAVNGQVYNLGYQRPYPEAFSSPECRYSGSIWAVEAVIQEGRQGRLISARCTGQRDELGLEAVLLVARYFSLLANGDYRGAYDLFTSAYKIAHPLPGFEVGVVHIDLRSRSLNTNCLEILRKISEKEIQIRAGGACNFSGGSDPAPPFMLELEREQSTMQVKIRKIEQEP